MSCKELSKCPSYSYPGVCAYEVPPTENRTRNGPFSFSGNPIHNFNPILWKPRPSLKISCWCLTLNALITTKVVCFSRLLKCLRSLYGKQCGPRSDCSFRSSLFWVHAVCIYTQFVSYARQLFAALDFSRRHFQMFFFSDALMVKMKHCLGKSVM